ncbi:MAG TPA: oligoendopeptidase F, partial [Gammaproteobacteria bacterium]|nr:oligoendopeptidase F [Gammaproteobacteria bacterium]
MTTDVGTVRWDLGDLYTGPEDPALAADLDAAESAAAAFREAHHGRVGSLGAAELAEAVARLEGLEQQLARPAVFIQLLHT